MSTLFYTGLSKDEFTSLFQSEDYTTIVVELPELVHQPNLWNSNFQKIRKVAKDFNSYVYISNSEYAHAKILLHKANYTDMINEFNSLGFVVRDNIFGGLRLDVSRTVIGLPYFIEPSHTELTGRGIKIAIIDTGIDDSHPDFSGSYPESIDKIIFWEDVTYEHESTPVDHQGHGTHVASIAAGTGAAFDGKFKGVAPDAKLIIFKTTTSNGILFDWDDLAHAINNALATSPDVISLSSGSMIVSPADWCDGTTSKTDIKGVYDAIRNALNRGIAVVVAAAELGPGYNTIGFPDCIDGVIAVGNAFKNDYDGYWNYNHYSDTEIHYIINLTSVLGGESEIFEDWYSSGTKNTWSGLQRSIFPYRWPAKINVFVEGKQRFRDCWPNWCNSGCEWWDSGWVWSKALNYDPNNERVIVEIANKPYNEEWVCFDIIGGWNNSYSRNDINVNIYQTSTATTEGLVAYDSSRGPPPQNSNLIKPDITAPGTNICAAKAFGTQIGDLVCGNNNYVSASGTSMAAPHVSGQIALLKEAASNAGITPTLILIRSALQKATQRVLPEHPDMTEGYGRINVQRSTDYITNCAFLFSIDYDDGGDNPLNPGSCYDFDKWYGESCTGTKYYDSCSGDWIWETYASGVTCGGYWKNCKDYDSSYTCKGNKCTVPVSSSGGGGGGGGRNYVK